MTRMTIGEVRQDLADTINRVIYQGERIVLQRHGKDVAAIVPMEALLALEALEDHQDLVAAEAALKEAEEKGTVPYDTLRKELGLEE